MDFDARINNLNAEITRLKTAHTKSASAMATKTQTINISLALEIKYSVQIFSVNRAIITLNANDNDYPLTMLSLNDTTVNDRQISIMRRPSSAGQVIYTVSIDEGNSSDYETIYAGGSVTVNLSLTATATADFTVSVGYEEYTPWG